VPLVECADSLFEGGAWGPGDIAAIVVAHWAAPTKAGSSIPGREPVLFEQYSHEPYIAVARFWTLAGISPSPEALEEKMRGGRAALKALDRHLSQHQFLVAERYTIADIALYAYTHVAPEGRFDLHPYAAVNEWLERVAAQPGHIPIDARISSA
jgi:glutathione S-transferase